MRRRKQLSFSLAFSNPRKVFPSLCCQTSLKETLFIKSVTSETLAVLACGPGNMMGRYGSGDGRRIRDW